MSIPGRSTFLISLLLGCFLYSMNTAAAANQVGDFEVIVYQKPNFVGASMSWRLEPGLHHRLVQNVSRDWKKRNGNQSKVIGSWGKGLVRSMKVGSQIGVYVFERADFCSTSADLRSGRFEIRPGLHETLGIWEGKVRSMILYRMKDRAPFGVLLMANPVEVTVSKEYAWVIPIKERRVRLPECVQFLPVSQRGKDPQRIYRNLGDFMGDRTVSIQVYGRDVKVELYRKSDLKGTRLVLPGQGSRETRFQLSTFNFQNDVSSARVFIDVPTSDQSRRSTPSRVRTEAPPASSKVRKEAPPVSSGSRQYCREYADRALQQRKERIEQTGSAPTNDPVWSKDWNQHYNWCAQVPKSLAKNGSKQRQDWLDSHSAGNPVNSKEAFCREYTKNALRQIQIRKRMGSRAPSVMPAPNDPVWKEDFNHHYNWCLGAPESRANQGSKMRQDWLDQHRMK